MLKKILFMLCCVFIFSIGFSSGLTFGEDRVLKSCERGGEALFDLGSIKCYPTSKE